MGNTPNIEYAYFKDCEEVKGETRPLRHSSLGPNEPLIGPLIDGVDTIKKGFK